MDSYHDDYFKEDRSRDIVWQEIVKYLSKYTGFPQSVLELGAGYCSYINAIDCPVKAAVDIWPEFSRYAENGISCLVADVRKEMNFKRKFDLIMASNLLEHLEMEEARELLHRCHRLLNRNGRLVLIQPNFKLCSLRYFDDYTHKTVFTDVTLRTVVEKAKFRIIRLEQGFMPLTMKSRLPKWRFLVRLYFNLPVRFLAGQMLLVAQKE